MAKEVMDHRNRPITAHEVIGVVVFSLFVLTMAVFSTIRFLLFGCQGVTEEEKRNRRLKIQQLCKKGVI